jgi:hypothetical protein
MAIFLPAIGPSRISSITPIHSLPEPDCVARRTQRFFLAGASIYRILAEAGCAEGRDAKFPPAAHHCAENRDAAGLLFQPLQQTLAF